MILVRKKITLLIFENLNAPGILDFKLLLILLERSL